MRDQGRYSARRSIAAPFTVFVVSLSLSSHLFHTCTCLRVEQYQQTNVKGLTSLYNKCWKINIIFTTNLEENAREIFYSERNVNSFSMKNIGEDGPRGNVPQGGDRSLLVARNRAFSVLPVKRKYPIAHSVTDVHNESVHTRYPKGTAGPDSANVDQQVQEDKEAQSERGRRDNEREGPQIFVYRNGIGEMKAATECTVDDREYQTSRDSVPPSVESTQRLARLHPEERCEDRRQAACE